MAHTCGFDPQNLRGFLIQPQRPQTLPAAPKTLYCIHSQRSQQFLDLMTPRVQQVGQSLRTPLRIQPAGEIRPLRADPPGATARIALMAHVTAQSHQGHSPDRTGIGTQGYGLGHVCGAADAPRGHYGGPAANAFVPQTLVHHGNSYLYGNAHVIPNDGGRRTRAASEPVQIDDIGARTDHTGGDGSHIMDCGDLYGDRLVPGGLLDCVYQLAEILNGVDVVVRSRREGIRTLGNHPGGRYFLINLFSRQVPADSRLGSLTYFDLHSRAGLQILRVDPKTPGSTLHHNVVGVGLKIGVEPTFAGIHICPHLLRCHGQRPVDVERDRAETHPPEHQGRIHLQLRVNLRGQTRGSTVLPGLDLHSVRLPTQVSPEFHRLPQGIYGGIGDLTGIEQKMVKDTQIRLIVTHSGQHDPTGLRLSPDGLPQLRAHTVRFFVGKRVLLYGDGIRRTVGHAAMAGGTLSVIRYGPAFRVQLVDLPTTLVHAPATLAAGFLNLATTGSPARGIQLTSGLAQISRMADSSLATNTRLPSRAATKGRSLIRSLRACIPSAIPSTMAKGPLRSALP